MEESVALAEFLYALSVATEEQGVSRSCSQWLAAEIGRLGNISDLNSKAPGEASSAVGDTISSAPGGGRHDRHGQVLEPLPRILPVSNATFNILVQDCLC